MQITMGAKIASSMQEVSSAVQTQVQKGVLLRQTATQAAIQAEGVIQIQMVDSIMIFYRWLTIMRWNVLLQAQAERQTQTMMAIQI